MDRSSHGHPCPGAYACGTPPVARIYTATISTTRLLLLGVVRTFQPAYGYLQELEQDGAHRPGRTSYKLTADGETEYFSLLRGMLWTVDGFHPDKMQATISFMWSLRRDEVIAALEARITQIESWLKSEPFAERQIQEDPGTPNHVVEMFRITKARDEGELRWTREFLERIRAGAYAFAGEPADWEPYPGMVTHWGEIPDAPTS